jgi:hypothetical protein
VYGEPTIGAAGIMASVEFILPPSGDATLLLRTEYSMEDRWRELLSAIATPSPDGFLANVRAVSDPRLDAQTADDVWRLAKVGERRTLTLVADARAQTDEGFPILVVDTFGPDQRSFRVTAACLWAVENNLSLANLDWKDFADNVDPDGVYRAC